MSFSTLFDHKLYRQSAHIGLLCNQASFDFNQKKYLFDLIIDHGKLYRLLLPEHGLFAEMQDQENVSDLKYRDIQCHSIYNKNRNTTSPERYMIEGCDLIIIDIFDVGVRYYTYSTHMFLLLKVMDAFYPEIPVFVMDRFNPIGLKVEGTIIQENYTSFLGTSGMIHRHGLSTSQLCHWYIAINNLNISIHNMKLDRTKGDHWIMPSPNLPTVTSLSVYPGQCFWEATTLSEGRGTTRPFEIFGHPALNYQAVVKISALFNAKYADIAFIRPLRFIPSYHKHTNACCQGWQIFIIDNHQFHSILTTLTLMKWVNEILGDDVFWRKGAYEFDSDANAAQLLLGDDELIMYVQGYRSEEEIKHKLNQHENHWKQSLLQVLE